MFGRACCEEAAVDTGFASDNTLLVQANMASAIRVCERELAAISGTGVLCITGSLHAVGAATSHFLGQ